MKPSLLPLLTCAECGGRFEAHSKSIEGTEIIEGTLVCSSCKAAFPITRGIPRFLPKSLTEDQKATADAFGYEWTNYSKLTDADKREFLGWISP